MGIIDQILSAPGTSTNRGAESYVLSEMLSRMGLSLPSKHKALVEKANGLTVCYGFHRLFGIGTGTGGISPKFLEFRRWNRTGTWKHAWPVDLRSMVCFAESVWGDQYAYDIAELGESNKRDDASVYLLDAYTMEARRIGTFDDYLGYELREYALEEMDATTRRILHRFGPIPVGQHLVPPATCDEIGQGTVRKLQRIDAVAAMVLNGDRATHEHACGNNKADAKYVSGVMPSFPVQEIALELRKPRKRVIGG